MDQSRLPIDVCERVIDMVAAGHFPSRTPYASHLNDMLACALTCHEWFPRSLYNIYHRLQVRSPRDLKRISNHFRLYPSYASLVQELLIGDSSNQENMVGYLPSTGEALARALPNLRILTLDHCRWHGLPHMRHGMDTRYPVVKLNVIGGEFKNLRDLLRMIWAFRQLRSLSLINVTIEKGSVVGLGGRLQFCENLREIRVVGVSRQLLPCHPSLQFIRVYLQTERSPASARISSPLVFRQKRGKTSHIFVGYR